MSSPKLACAGVVASLAVSACGTLHKPEAGERGATGTTYGSRGAVDDPRAAHLKCLRSAHLQVIPRGKSDLLIGTPPHQVAVTFTPTPGSGQEEQITGHVQGAEVIGSALLYPGSAPDSELTPIENCLAQGVKG